MARTLIVEDEPNQAALLAEIVRALGMEPTIVYSAESALRAARDHMPDLIFLDLMLPDMDGFRLCRMLRELDTKSIPIIIVSALVNDDIVKETAIRVGATDCIAKPYSLGDIARSVADIQVRPHRGANAIPAES